MVGGSFASGAWGEPRHTNDIDIVADINSDRASCLENNAKPLFEIGSQELKSALATRSESACFQMLHNEALFKVDVFLLADTDFDKSTFSRKLRIELAPGLLAYCQSPEDMILRKLQWYEFGNRVSDRQWHDVVKMLEIQRENLDASYLSTWSQKLRMHDSLEQAKREAWNGE
jgi:hypothetical protein